MREPDLDSIKYVQTHYAPFKMEMKEDKRAGKGVFPFECDFCRGTFTKVVRCTSEKDAKKQVLCCMGKCLDLLVPQKRASLFGAEIMGDGGLIEMAPGTSAVEASDVLEALDAEAAVKAAIAHPDMTAIVKRAKILRQAGFGKQWKIVPALLDAHERTGVLSDKQIGTLKKYINSCEEEVSSRG